MKIKGSKMFPNGTLICDVLWCKNIETVKEIPLKTKKIHLCTEHYLFLYPNFDMP